METRPPIRTPRHLRPGHALSGLSNESVPKLDFRSDFFLTVRPKWWTFEGYLDHGYLNVNDFLHDLGLLGERRANGPHLTLLKKHCYGLSKFLNTDDGKLLLRLMKTSHTVRQETQMAVMNATITGFRGPQQEQGM